MTVLFADGHTGQPMERFADFSGWTDGTSGTITIDGAVAHHGANSAYVNNQQLGMAAFNLVSQPLVYARAYFRLDAISETNFKDHDFMYLFAGATALATAGVSKFAGGAGIFNWHLKGNNNGVDEDVYSTFTVDPAHWYCFELKAFVDGVAGEYRLYIEGVDTLDLLAKDTDNFGNMDTVFVGDQTSALADTLHFDCVTVADAYVGTELSRCIGTFIRG